MAVTHVDGHWNLHFGLLTCRMAIMLCPVGVGTFARPLTESQDHPVAGAAGCVPVAGVLANEGGCRPAVAGAVAVVCR
jgi:hypothetical protein